MTIKEVKEFLGNIQPFQGLDDSALANIAGGVIVEYYPKGTVILHEENSSCEYLQIIKKGNVEVKQGKENTTEYRGKGNSFGYLRDAAGSKINISAIEDTTCYLVSKEILHKILEIHPSIPDLFNFKTRTKLKKKGGR